MFFLERCWILNKIAGLGPRMTRGKLENCIMQKKAYWTVRESLGSWSVSVPKSPGWWCSTTEDKGKSVGNKRVIYDGGFLSRATACGDCCSQNTRSGFVFVTLFTPDTN